LLKIFDCAGMQEFIFGLRLNVRPICLGVARCFPTTANRNLTRKVETSKFCGGSHRVQLFSSLSPQSGDEWKEFKEDKTGRPYYFNIRTGKTQWEAPSSAKLTLEDKDHPFDEWQQYRDEKSGKFYYFNLRTQDTQWERPERFYPVGTGIDESKWMTFLRSDRLSANPYAPIGKWTKVANVVCLVMVTTGLIYTIYIKPKKETQE